MILSRCQKQKVQNECNLELISQKLESEHVVVQQENSMVKIVKESASNSCSTSIAILAAQLLLASVESSTAMHVSEKTLQNLLIATGSYEDKEARKVAMKCIYLLSVVQKANH